MHSGVLSQARVFRRPWMMVVLISLAFAAGFVLSLLSWFEVCTSACAEGTKFRLLGVPFAPFGILFFTIASCLWVLSFRNHYLLTPLKLLITAALGAELHFLYLQKFIIGKWCPLCLGIFSCIATISVLFASDYLLRLMQAVTTKTRSRIMKMTGNGVGTLSILFIGFLTAFFGVAKVDNVFSESIGKETIYFGKKNSTVEVYVFTDWFCPACHKVTPFIERKAPEIAQHARLFFIDAPIHDQSMNYLPYNLSFLVKEKKNYLKLRRKLEEVAKRGKTPTDQEVEKLAESIGTRYQPLDYSEINLGRQYFEETTKKFGVDSTPTVIIVNPTTKQQKKLIGVKDIINADFPALIRSLQ